MKKITTLLLITIEAGMLACTAETNIDRFELVNRNNPIVTHFDPLTPLSVGNGEFAVTVDPTGLQSFPTYYTDGIPLGTMSQWGWHSFINTENFKHDETLKVYDFGKGKQELYAVQSLPTIRQQDAAQWFRSNPHRLHLGIVGFEFQENVTPDQFTNLKQTLDLWKGIIYSNLIIDYNLLALYFEDEDLRKDYVVLIETNKLKMNELLSDSRIKIVKTWKISENSDIL
jgi:hypothetical protein